MSSNLQGSALQSYLIREVQTLCDADPDLVAQYITALIGSGDPPHILRQSLDEKLREFFGDQTGPFIDRLFKELGYDSNDKHDSNNDSRAPERSRQASDYSDEEDDGDRNFKHRRPRSEAARDNDGRYSRSSGDDRHYNSSGSSRDRRHVSDGYGGSRHSRNEGYRTGSNSIPRGPAAMYDRRQQHLSSLPPHRGPGGGGGRGGYRGDISGGRPMRPLCRDYNERGYCTRGDMCPYDHGADRIVVDDGSFSTPTFPNVSTQMGPPLYQQQQAAPPFFGMPGNFDAYDPERATLMPNSGNIPSFPVDVPGMMMPATSDNMGGNRMFATPRGGGMMRGRGGRGGRGRGGGHMGPVHHKRQNTTLVVENIPTEFCEISKVNEYFKKFGSLTNISVQSHMHKAILQFATNAEANAAYSSPDPIFDNRFVKVYWCKENEDDNKAASSDASGGRAKPDTKSSPSTTTSMKRQSEPDPEEVAARAAELAKLREEKQKKHQERMKAILDVQKQKEQLLQKQIEEQKQLMGKLSNSKDMTKAEKEELLKSLKKIAKDIDISRAAKASALPPSMTTTAAASASAQAPTQQTPAEASPYATASEPTGETADGATATSSEELAAKLAKLEAEAASLGITPQSQGGGYHGGRGGYYGRGRGYPRMRGGGAVRYSLDNRPTKIFVKGVPEDAKDEMRKHFEQFGNLTMVESHEDGIIVDYSQRFESEKAMVGGTSTPRGKLEFSWYTGAMSNGSSQPSTPTSTTTAATTSEAPVDGAA
ncbi:hypothetical protein BDB00DRAFT_795946 [Zychaea mexicana]|uniref:uncharacterized protein n=1 Tax=Zychaea mexicana TaxID=64656 RepID=UPI0022FDE0BA|nr:uncharacterized protein BDB00DRAFT_795946 [Zychaea mexicana]KAI9499232.1 hypothetical protein BDB00DRAFT_795946 [Zychaea mexicana]